MLSPGAMVARRFLRLNRIVSVTKSSTTAFSTSRVHFGFRIPSIPPKSAPSFDLSTSNNKESPDVNQNPIQGKATESDTYSRTSEAYRIMAKDHSAKRTPQSDGKVKDLKFSMDLAGQISRRWKAGDVYAPHDLHQAELSKYKQRTSPSIDVFDLLDLNPLEHYRNFSIMSEWITPMGRIKSRKETGLRPVNQRRIAKAIRRSIGIGMMSSVHRHPEILYKDRSRLEIAGKKY